MEELPKRKKGRLTGYDYSANGSYYITVCTRDKQHILGHSVGGGVLDAPYVRLSKCGAMVRDTLLEMDAFYDEITIHHYVIMPNHVHLLLLIQGDGRALRAPTVSNIVQQLKSCVTKHLHHPIWQKSFHDHVIRTQTDYETIWLYIDSNPQTWQTDCLNPNRNKPQQSDTRKDVTL